MALGGEAGELLEIFQWLTPTESGDLDNATLHHVGEELADILIYLVRLADTLQLDLNKIVWGKCRANEQRYRTTEVRGSAEKR